MRIVVTGANGFVGRPTCLSLTAAGHQVTAVIRHANSAPGLTAHKIMNLGDLSGDTDWSGALAEAGGHLPAFLAGLPDLVVFNAAGRHLHHGVDEWARWPASLDRIAGQEGRRFVRIDFPPEPSGGPDDDPGMGTDPAWPVHRVVDPGQPDA